MKSRRTNLELLLRNRLSWNRGKKIEHIMFVLSILLAVILSILLQLAAHEFGHMLAGAVTGWRLIYLQIFRIALVNESKHYRLKRVPTYGYRCLMYPKELFQNAAFYTLGGLFMNLLLTIAGVAGMMKYSNHSFIRVYDFGLSVFGIMFLITNGVPNIERVCNDMACLMMLKHDGTSKKSHNCQMMIAHGLFEGKTYRQMDRSLVEVGETRINTDILAYHAVLEYYYHLDRDAYLLARDALDKIEMQAPISQEVRNIINMELLYIDLVTDIIHMKHILNDYNRYPEGLESFIKEHEVRGDIHSFRVKIASEAHYYYMKGDLTAAIKRLDQGISDMLAMEYLYLGEKLFCIDQLTGIRNMMQRDLVLIGKTGTDNQ